MAENIKWWQRSVVYQVYPRSFQDSNGDGIGDIPGITKRLPYIADLGVDALWLSPVYKSPNDDNGYDISDYQDIMDEFGTMADFDEMVETAHGLGLKIVMDLVVNHTSDEHKWFIESRKSKDNPYRDYYFWREGKNGGPPNNWGSFVGGGVWEYDEATKMYYLHFFSKKQPDLNWENPAVRDEVYSMMKWWLDEKKVDGFRMDVINLISKDPSFPDGKADASGYAHASISANGPRIHEFLREMNERVLSRYDIMTVGECPQSTVEDAAKYANLDGSELGMVFQFEHMEADFHPVYGKWTAEKGDLRKLKAVLNRWQTGLGGRAWNSLYWNNHDQPRIVSRWGDDSDEYRVVSAKMLASCLHMMQGTPYIYQGEELGMTNYPWKSMDEMQDHESLGTCRQNIEKGIEPADLAFEGLKLKTRDNARTPMQWDTTENAGFSTGKPWMSVNPNYTYINAAEEVKNPDSVYNYYKKLISLRHEMDIITLGSFRLLEPESEKLFIYEREYKGEKLLTVCNFSKDKVSYGIPAEYRSGEILISNYPDSGKSGELRAYEAFVIYVE